MSEGPSFTPIWLESKSKMFHLSPCFRSMENNSESLSFVVPSAMGLGTVAVTVPDSKEIVRYTYLPNPVLHSVSTRNITVRSVLFVCHTQNGCDDESFLLIHNIMG